MDGHLNAAQQEAVRTLRGPLLVLAGAGTGKTRVVTHRIARLVRHRVEPGRILGVTFTNKAAREMQGRAAELLGRKLKEKPEISTFHSLCVRILRRHATKLGYPERFAIHDRSDQEGLARSVLRELRVPGQQLRPGEMLAIISQWKCEGIRPPKAVALAAGGREHLAASAYRRYQQQLKAAGAVDFDDLLLLVEELFDQHPDARREEAGRFDHVLIDEYQDTNGVQYRLVKALAAGHRNLCVVGDDDQAIYGWRGADVSHILRFKNDWPEAKVVRLVENYRSTAPILELANRLIAFNGNRHPKRLESVRPGGLKPRIMPQNDGEREAEAVVKDIVQQVEHEHVRRGDIAILVRTNELTRAYEMELRRVGVPYVLVGGQSFYDRKEVKDVLAYLKVLAWPQDETPLLRIMNRPARGIGDTTRQALLDRAVAEGRPVWDVLRPAAAEGALGASASSAVERFADLLDDARRRLEGEAPSAVLTRLLEEMEYRDFLAREYEDPNDADARYNAVEQVVNGLAETEGTGGRDGLIAFLDQVAIGGPEQPDSKEEKLSADAVVLMTLHSAKGLEFPHVYLVGLEEEILPHKRALAEETIDEERRLCYVGVTRAQERLTLTYAEYRMKWGKKRQRYPSRFLYEMTGRADNPFAMKKAAAGGGGRGAGAGASKSAGGGKPSGAGKGAKRGAPPRKKKKRARRP